MQGSTIATIDSETSPSPGIKKITTGERVILFSGIEDSGYETMIKRKLKAMGRDPDSFSVGPLPWGTRVGNTPIIAHKGRFYLQAVRIHSGQIQTFIGDTPVPPEDVLKPLFSQFRQRDLPKDEQVHIRTYALDSIKKITLLREELANG